MRDEVYIIGGGASLKNYNFEALTNKDTIVINKAIYHVPNPNHFITIDQTVFRKMDRGYFQRVNCNKVFIANFTYPYMIEKDGQIIDSRHNIIYNLQDFNMIIKSYKREGFGLVGNEFSNGDNSGYCALQLAIILGYKKIFLLGIDLKVSNKDTHFHEGYGQSIYRFSKKLYSYFELFKKGIEDLKILKPDIEIYSCSEISPLNEIIPYQKI